MIFVLDETGVLHVASSVAELQGAFEGVDVENGIYRFFDESGKPLVAEFVVPNERGRTLGLVSWVRSGTYRLIGSDDVSVPHLSEVLNTDVGLAFNRHFLDLDAVRRSLASCPRQLSDK